MDVLSEDHGPRGGQRSIQDLEERGYSTDMFRYISEGWGLFQKNPGVFILITVITAGIWFIMFRLRYAYLVNLLVTPCLWAGFLLMARNVRHDLSTDIAAFFGGFRQWQVIVPYQLVAQIFTVIGYLFLVLPGIYLSISYIFVLPIILFYREELSLIEVLEGSRKVITVKWWEFLGFALLLVGVNILGAIALGVGLLVSIPVSMCAIYCAYEDIFGVPEEHY